jgi:RNA polymerase sigma factor (sigma-70 family)
MKFIQLNEEELLKAIRSGQDGQRNQAYRQLYMNQALNNKVKAMVADYRLTSKTFDDVLQEGIILLDKLITEGKFEGRSKVTTFLVAVCRNIIRDANKKVDRIQLKETIQDADLKKLDEENLPELELAELNEEEKQRDRTLNQVLGSLTEKCRQALTLYYYDNKNMEQIADQADLANKNQAKKKVHTCREQLRKLILENPVLVNILKMKK